LQTIIHVYRQKNTLCLIKIDVGKSEVRAMSFWCRTPVVFYSTVFFDSHNGISKPANQNLHPKALLNKKYGN